MEPCLKSNKIVKSCGGRNRENAPFFRALPDPIFSRPSPFSPASHEADDSLVLVATWGAARHPKTKTTLRPRFFFLRFCFKNLIFLYICCFLFNFFVVVYDLMKN